ncbi:MAG: hypothetical protein RLZZ522_396 [Verrucomicrobiota bacterium]|jgi:hypothetical protein
MKFRYFTPLALALAGCTPTAEQPAARHRQMYGLVQKFDRFDDNGDGYLTRKELTQGAATTGLPLTPEKLDRVMTGYDKNGDKRISQVEAQQGADLGPDIFGPE